MADHDDLINQFTGMTGTSPDRAQFFLEMANWDLEMALTQYYDSGEESNASSTPVSEPFQPGAPESFRPVAPTPQQPISSPSSSQKRKPASRFRTLNDLKNDSDDEGRQNYFAGGEKSGMVVQDPSKRDPGANVIDEILKKAAAGGPSNEVEEPKKKKPVYRGTGYTLGSDEVPSMEVPGEDAHQEEDLNTPVSRQLTFWRNGFSVEDGPLLRYDDPANASMLSEINQGRAPLSLLNVRHGQPVDVKVARRQDEDYIPPKPAKGKRTDLFALTSGARLGSGSPSSSTTPSQASSTPSQQSSTQTLEIDASLPTTQLQIRLADGSKLVAKFNQTHTIGDVRAYINSQRPGQANYTLQTSFPVKPLEDNSQSLKEAGLLNSVVIQRLG
ncbi:SEP-domain-containing protein [Hesseltinella vesiculosa]|uniref:SEP-domain-containing protein n=1 Tax=Hesseltinella vesiculosa TaxID=101127 RepID=A0A1X2GB31_9FUNG|nr:SEP-domain-containing protein [Hesseltinella vesiculosa]